MRKRSRRHLILGSALAAILAALGVAACGTLARGPQVRTAWYGSDIYLPAPPTGASVLTVRPRSVQRAIPSGFLGLSFEYPAVQTYAGENEGLLEQLIRNITPGQAPVLRIGGDSTDKTWWPVPGMPAPPGIKYTLNDRWIGLMRSLAQGLHAHLIMGVNLEADNLALSTAEAEAFVDGIGSRWVEALEPGNEPELYARFGWYRASDGLKVRGRPPGWDVTEFAENFNETAASLPPVQLAGPAIGGNRWMSQLGDFLASDPRLGMITLHRYPLQLCYLPAASPLYPTIPHLLSPQASAGLADSVLPQVALAHERGLPLRIDEFNSVSCGGQHLVSDTFASALWVVDALFQMVRVGVDGVNVHTFPKAAYNLFQFKRVHGSWQAFVTPEYYGLMMFAQAAPAGSQLLNLPGSQSSPLRTWATRTPDGRIRVVLINDTNSPQVAIVRARQANGGATLERLEAPNVAAPNGVTLGGDSFGAATGTGILPGPLSAEPVTRIANDYVVKVPPASAALLTLTGPPGTFAASNETQTAPAATQPDPPGTQADPPESAAAATQTGPAGG